MFFAGMKTYIGILNGLVAGTIAFTAIAVTNQIDVGGGTTLALKRSSFSANGEKFAVGFKFSSSGGPFYIGANDATADPGFQISNAGGGRIISGTATGVITITGALSVNGSTNPGSLTVLGGNVAASSLATSRSLAGATVQSLSTSGWLFAVGMLANLPYIQVVDQAGTSAGHLAIAPFGGSVAIGLGTAMPSATLHIKSFGGSATTFRVEGNGLRTWDIISNTDNFLYMTDATGGLSIARFGYGGSATSPGLTVFRDDGLTTLGGVFPHLDLRNTNNTANNWGAIQFSDATGSYGAGIHAQYVAHPGTPPACDLVFATRPSGGVYTERARLKSTGGLIIAGAVSPVTAAGQLGIGANFATTATTGASGALPAQVAGYLAWTLNGSNIKIAYYNA